MRIVYISKNYNRLNTGGSKAKMDVEAILNSEGAINIGLGQSKEQSKVSGFFYNFFSIVKACLSFKKGDIFVQQYPFKKYYTFLCKAAHLRGAKVVTLIHDLGAFRRKKITAETEKKRLDNTDYIIALNPHMKKYLVEQGFKQPIGILYAWDYISDNEPNNLKSKKDKIEIIYAGSLPMASHSFLYQLAEKYPSENYYVTVYGSKFEPREQTDMINYQGLKNSDDIISETTGDYGLVWYGNSLDKIDGYLEDYIKITTSHKPSLYLRCEIPVIVWNKTAYADFVRENKVGICIDSLVDLDKILSEITEEEYNTMKVNAKAVSNKLRKGFYFKRALKEAEAYFVNR